MIKNMNIGDGAMRDLRSELLRRAIEIVSADPHLATESKAARVDHVLGVAGKLEAYVLGDDAPAPPS